MNDFYLIIVRPKAEFVAFRFCGCGHSNRNHQLEGQTGQGNWNTQAWYISKNEAHIDEEKLVGDSEEAKSIISSLKSGLSHLDDSNIFVMG